MTEIHDDWLLWTPEAVARLREDFTRYSSGVPEHTVDGLLRYVLYGVPPGDFLRAVLENKLIQSLGRADEENRATIFAIANLVYNAIPTKCRGSEDIVRDWLFKGREHAERLREMVMVTDHD